MPDLNKTEQKKIIEYLINNKTIKECSNLIEKSEYKLRQFLRKIGISNIQKFMQNSSNLIILTELLKNYE